MKRLRRIEIVVFRRRTIVVADGNQGEDSTVISAGSHTEVRFGLTELAAAEPGVAKALEASRVGSEMCASNYLLLQMRHAFGRLGIGLNNLRKSWSNNHGEQ